MNWSESIKSFSHFIKLELGLSENTLCAYRSDLSQLAVFLSGLGSENPAQTKGADLGNFLAAMQQAEAEVSTRARMLSSIKRFFGFLAENGHIEENPTDFMSFPMRSKRKLPEVLTIGEVLKILEATNLNTNKGVRDRAIVEILYSSGLRVSELAGLQKSDLHLENCVLKVAGKGNKERFVPLGKEAIRYLRLYLESVRNRQATKPAHKNHIFLNRNAAPLSRISIFKTVRTLAQLAGIRKKVSPHTFRHTFATHLVERGADLRAVQAMLGHESITTTEIYTHLNVGYLTQTILKHHPRSKEM